MFFGEKRFLFETAIFEQENPSSAPFLIPLSFLIHCKGTIVLDSDKGLTIVFQDNKDRVPLHLGPTGALRIPIQEFSKDQLNVSRGYARFS